MDWERKARKIIVLFMNEISNVTQITYIDSLDCFEHHNTNAMGFHRALKVGAPSNTLYDWISISTLTWQLNADQSLLTILSKFIFFIQGQTPTWSRIWSKIFKIWLKLCAFEQHIVSPALILSLLRQTQIKELFDKSQLNFDSFQIQH